MRTIHYLHFGGGKTRKKYYLQNKNATTNFNETLLFSCYAINNFLYFFLYAPAHSKIVQPALTHDLITVEKGMGVSPVESPQNVGWEVEGGGVGGVEEGWGLSLVQR